MVFIKLSIFVCIALIKTSAAVKLEKAANCFTLSLYKQLVNENNNNMITSPFSLNVLLSALLGGAGGQTAQELTQVLGYKDLSVADMQDAFKDLLTSLGNSGSNKLNMATSVWLQETHDVNHNFRKVVEDKFFTDVMTVDFERNSDVATREINSWVRDKTRGLIGDVFHENLRTSTLMAIVNAIYFKGQWEKKFSREASTRRTFHNRGSLRDTSQVEMMTKQTKLRYKYDSTLKTEVLEMDYEGNVLSMVIFLPEKRLKFEDFEQSLTCDAVELTLDSGIPTTVDVTIPVFKVSSSFDLENSLWELGVQRVFDMSANLSGIAKNMHVTKAVQKTVFRVSEDGSEGAVVSSIVAGKRTAAYPPEFVYFIADRPFIFLVKHKPSKLILFVGRVVELPDY